MATPREQTVAAADPAIEDLIATADEIWRAQADALERLNPASLDRPDGGGWTARQLLSHLIGSWQRLPVWASFFLDGDPSVPVPIHPHDPFWIPEWETAPLASFKIALAAAVEGHRAFLRTLDGATLARAHQTPFGELTLADFLAGNYRGHFGGHQPQLQAFTGA